ncbi:MAG: ATP-binding cassette domain-containing protein [Phycisphaerae bacterium]
MGRATESSRPVGVGMPLLEAADLCVEYPVRAGAWGGRSVVRAVDHVDLEIRRGEALGLVGESGSGKSTIGRALVGLVRPVAGRILLEGREIHRADRGRWRELSRNIQMVFQDTAGSLNPRIGVGRIVAEPLVIHGIGSGRSRARRVERTLERVGLGRGLTMRYPHELSGGQRQRVGIARALILEPQLLICDEATSALDLSIQAQIVNLLLDLREDRDIALLFITHDMGVVRCVCDRVAVMRRGRIVEHGDVDALFAAPRHVYTRQLLDAIPIADPTAARLGLPLGDGAS